jgi:predicted nucleotidyltransferase
MILYPDNIPVPQLESLKKVCTFFLRLPIHGIYANGSMATGAMDNHSDLDLAVTFSDPKNLYDCWRNRYRWEITGILHRFDADHRKNNFIVLIFENGVKVDVFLTMPGSIKPVEKPPFLILYDPEGGLSKELAYNWPVFTPSAAEIDWMIKEEERFWGWMQFEYNHFQRGNYLLLADDFFVFRKILQSWLGLWVEGRKLTAKEFTDHPMLEEWHIVFARELFPTADREEQLKAHQWLIRCALKIRKLLSERYSVGWKTSDRMIEYVCNLFEVYN